MEKRDRRGIWFLVAALAVSAALNVCTHAFDNKYRYNTEEQPICGILELTEAELSRQAYYLCDDWEYYGHNLLSPQDFATGDAGKPEKYVRLGQYAGFEMAENGANPHGSATYRLRLFLPEKGGTYELELPEIYSAYRLWIAGNLVYQSGDPDPQSYRPEVVQTKVTFQAAGETELIFAVSDFSHYYSGMVYPPAFGTEQQVERLQHGRLLIKGIQCFLATMMLFCYLAMWVVQRQNRKWLCFALICAGYLGYASYLLVRTFLPTGNLFWYRMEDFSFLFMLFFVSELTSLQWKNNHWKNNHWKSDRWNGNHWQRGRWFMRATGLLAMAASIVVPSFFLAGGLPVMRLYGCCIDIYQWIVVVCLIGRCSWMFFMGVERQELLLAGVLFFGVSLLADCLDSRYEPILLGWGTEYGGFVLLCVLAVLLVLESIATQRNSRELVANEERKEKYFREVVHDLNSPLALITTYAELSSLGLVESEEQQREFLEQISARAKELSERIARLRKRDVEAFGHMDFVTVGSREYLCSLQERYGVLLAGKGVSLLVEGEDFPIQIDREKMDIAMENLIMNGMRFTDPGGSIILSARHCQGKGELRVRDTGAGMSDDVMRHIFERGYTQDREKHSGLGLPIVSQIATAHHGSVTVESQLGRGSCFILRLDM